MYLLNKIIQLRDKSHPDHEKPFLEHLEDLRTMIFRIVITLVISMIVCFTFNNKLMAFFRRPVDQVLLAQTQASLPEAPPRQVSVETWERARKVEHASMNLTPDQRELFYGSLGDETLAFHAKSVSLYRAALALPADKRDPFVNSLTEAADLKLQVQALLKSKPNADSDAQGNLRMMSALKPTEGFMLSMKLSFVAGIVVSFPLLLMYILQFVLPGLHSHEKRVLWPAMAVGFGLFLCGTTFAYYMVLPRTLLFFYQWSGDMGISNDWRIGEYISFATQFTLLFGVAFELPVVVMVFVKLGLLGYETMARTRSYAIVAIFVAAAVLTPTPDIATMCVMALPMLVLYEICIWLAWFDRRKSRMLEEQEARENALRPQPQEPAEPTEHDLGMDPWQDPPADPFSHPYAVGDDGWTHTDAPQEFIEPPEPLEIPEKAPAATPDSPPQGPPQTTVETPVETLAETPAETPVETLAETPAETPVETLAETPVETLAETPVENLAETPAETLAETPAETPVETPAVAPPDGDETTKDHGRH